MKLEIRYLAPTADIVAVEVSCKKPDCSGKLQFDLKEGCIKNDQKCPRCGDGWWWHPNNQGPVYTLLMALMNYLGSANNPGVTFVFPEPDKTSR